MIASNGLNAPEADSARHDLRLTCATWDRAERQVRKVLQVEEGDHSSSRRVRGGTPTRHDFLHIVPDLIDEAVPTPRKRSRHSECPLADRTVNENR